jgi:radial spoke head protein 1
MGAICPCIRQNDLDGETAMVSRYDGERNCLGQRHGYGVYMFANGDLYEGCWKYNKMHGFGQYTPLSGEK